MFFRWLDDRTGYKQFLSESLYQRIPGGPRWRYVWGTTLLFAFVTQLVTGVFLWMHYSPSTQTAWESVYYIEFQLAGGWLLRGVHHYMAQAMMVLMALHLMQVVVHGAYRAPREINFWTGLVLLLLVLALGFTGYLLPWDQRGFRATQVATTIASASPAYGSELKALIIGGNEFGHLTLTRFFSLHAGILPGIMIAVLAVHVSVFRKHGVTVNDPDPERDVSYWPHQALRDLVACLAVLVTVCLLAGLMRAELGPPADGTQSFNSARPEWYFLFLFQLLKVVDHVAPGEAGIQLGAYALPAVVFGVMILMPFIGRWKLGHRFNVVFLFCVLLGIIGLTGMALQEDYGGSALSDEYLAAKAMATAEAERTHEIAAQGILPTGILPMVRDDVKIAGYRLFQRHCASCHGHYDTSGTVTDPLMTVKPEKELAPNLFGVGNREWMAKMLDHEKFIAKDMFGYQDSPFVESDMAEWLADTLKDPEEPEEIEPAVEASIEYLAHMADLPYEADKNKLTDEQLEAGDEAIAGTLSCIDCHNYEGTTFALVADDDYYYDAPDLTGYMSRDWMLGIIRKPEALQFYGERNDRMPAYGPHDDEQLNKMTDRELEIVVDWLRQDWELRD